MKIFKAIQTKRQIKKMANIKLSNFAKPNTPKGAEMLGNIGLILAAVASLPVILAGAGVAVPAAIVTAAVYATVGGSLVKTVSKTLGVKEEEKPE
jgi:hypothetical protein